MTISQINDLPKEVIANTLSNSVNISEFLRKTGISGRGKDHKRIEKYLNNNGFDISHLKKYKRSQKRDIFMEKIFSNETFVVSYEIKKKLLKFGYPNRCDDCGHEGEWNGKNINLVLDHISGNFRDNRFGNLRLLCPNCNSMTPTYCNSNKKQYDIYENFVVEREEQLKNLKNLILENEKEFLRTYIPKKPFLNLKRKSVYPHIDEYKRYLVHKKNFLCAIYPRIEEYEKYLKKQKNTKHMREPSLAKHIFNKEVLQKEVLEFPLSALCKKYGYSDKGLKKVCMRLGIDVPKADHFLKGIIPKSACKKGNFFKKTKLDDLDFESLSKLVWEKSLTQIGKEFGLSKASVKRRTDNLGIVLPPREHWYY